MSTSPSSLPTSGSLEPWQTRHWYRLTVRLQCTKKLSSQNAKPVWKVLDTIAKNVALVSLGRARYVPGEGVVRDPAPKSGTDSYLSQWLFRWKASFWEKPRLDQVYEGEILYWGESTEALGGWTVTALELQSQPFAIENFRVLDIPGGIEERSLATLRDENQSNFHPEEILLEFPRPLSFRRTPGRQKHYWSVEEWLVGLSIRLNNLFGFSGDLEPLSSVHFLPFFWDEVELPLPSSKGTSDLQAGMMGAVVVRGDIRSIWDLILICQEVHLPSLREKGRYRSRPEYDEGQFLVRPTRSFFKALFYNDDAFWKPLYDEMFFKREEGTVPPSWEQCRVQLEEIRYSSRYTPEPYQALLIPKATMLEGETAHQDEPSPDQFRRLEMPSFFDKLFQRGLVRLLEPVLDKSFEQASLGYRHHTGTNQAAQRLRGYFEQGYVWIGESDVEDFFPSIEYPPLAEKLRATLAYPDHFVISLVLAACAAPFKDSGNLVQRLKGLPQGSPLSPLLSNLYLDSFDEAFLNQDTALVRFADDFVLLGKLKEAVEKGLERAQLALEELGLRMKASKTKVVSLEEGFRFLGKDFAGQDWAEGTVLKRFFKKPLYITRDYVSLGLQSEALVLRDGDSPKITLPLHRISEIFVLGHGTVNDWVIDACLERGITLNLSLPSGGNHSSVTIAADSAHQLRVHGKHWAVHQLVTPEVKIKWSRNLLWRKNQTYRFHLKELEKLHRARVDVPRQKLSWTEFEQAMRGLEKAESQEQLMGFEGDLSRRYYEILRTFLTADAFHFAKRDRSSPDRFNTLLNYTSSLTAARINATLRSMGLNPYLGILHSDQNRYESLVWDLVELFRGSNDRFLLRSINRGEIKPDHFQQGPRGWYLSTLGRKLFLDKFEAHLHQDTLNPIGGTSYTLQEGMVRLAMDLRAWVTPRGDSVPAGPAFLETTT